MRRGKYSSTVLLFFIIVRVILKMFMRHVPLVFYKLNVSCSSVLWRLRVALSEWAETQHESLNHFDIDRQEMAH